MNQPYRYMVTITTGNALASDPRYVEIVELDNLRPDEALVRGIDHIAARMHMLAHVDVMNVKLERVR